MTGQRRRAIGRVGVTLLNLLAPGLGLLRIGRLRRAIALYGAAIAASLAFIATLASIRDISFTAYAVAACALILSTLAVLALSMWWTWRDSSHLPDALPLWSRWYSVVGTMLIAFVISWVLTDAAKTAYHNFYVPSEAMEPTLDRNDRFVASMRRPVDLHRGDIVLVNADTGVTYVKRLAALPGDTIALKDGVVFINGRAAELKLFGAIRVSHPYIEVTEARLYRERLPGEPNAHLIQDLGPSPEDNMSEIKIPPAYVFVLGDNRDDSADSRVPKYMGGLELVPIDRVAGRALFFYWPLKKSGHSMAGTGQ